MESFHIYYITTELYFFHGYFILPLDFLLSWLQYFVLPFSIVGILIISNKEV